MYHEFGFRNTIGQPQIRNISRKKHFSVLVDKVTNLGHNLKCGLSVVSLKGFVQDDSNQVCNFESEPKQITKKEILYESNIGVLINTERFL